MYCLWLLERQMLALCCMLLLSISPMLDFEKDLLDVSKAAIAMDVEVGMCLGKAAKSIS